MIEAGFLVWVLAGLAAGLMIGLAGAGGGIVAIPFFIYFGQMTFREASGYSLVVVTVGAFLSWVAQRKYTRFRISLIIVACSIPTSYALSRFKHLIPPWVDIAVLWAVCLYGLHRIWSLKDQIQTANVTVTYSNKEYVLAAVCGVALGGLVSLIGVGGGLITVPFLLIIMKLPIRQAVATDIFCILIVAPFSAWAQDKLDISIEELSGLVGGVLVSTLLFEFLRRYLSENTTNNVRKGALSLAIILALMSSVLRNPLIHKYEHELIGANHAKPPVISSAV